MLVRNRLAWLTIWTIGRSVFVVQVPQKEGEFLASRASITFSEGPVLFNTPACVLFVCMKT